MAKNLGCILEDLPKKELFPMKLIMFLIYGGQACLYPFFIVHLWSLNLDIQEVTAILSVQPLVGCVATLLIQAIARRVNNVKALFCFSIIISAVVTNSLQLIPPNRRALPEVRFRLECVSSHQENSNLRATTDNSCTFKQALSFHTPIRITMCENSTKPLEFCFKNTTFNNQECVKFNSTLELTIRGDLNVNISSNEALFHIRSVTFKNNTHDSLFCTHSTECDCVSRADDNLCVKDKNSTRGTQTFWFYFGIRLALTFFSAIVISLFDVMSVSTLERVRGNLILQRLWATISVCILAPVGGYLLDRKYIETIRHDYSSSFYIYSVFFIVAALISVFADFSLKKTYSVENKNWKAVLGDLEQLFLIINLFILGICWGYVDNFLLLYMHSELGAGHLMMGLTIAVGTVVCIPMTAISAWFTSKSGYTNVIVLAFIAYTIKFLCYYFLKSAFWCLVLELLNVFTISLLISGAAIYSSKIGTASTVTTTVAAWNGGHFVIGRAVGAVAGGFGSGSWGHKQTFLAFAYVTAIMALVVFVFQFILMKCRKTIKDTQSNISCSSEDDITDDGKEDSGGCAVLSSLILPFLESSGLSPFHITWVLKGDRRPTLAEEVRRRSGFQDDLRFFYCLGGGGGGSAAQRQRRNSFPTGGRGVPCPIPNSRRASAVNFRASLAPVPEEVTGSFTPECPKKPAALRRFEKQMLGPRGEPEGCENDAYEEDTVA